MPIYLLSPSTILVVEVTIKLKNMIDDKKIEAAARRYSEVTDCDKQEALLIEEGFKEGAEWAIKELLKELFHPASEVPRNDNGKVLAFSRIFCNRKLFDMNAMLDETTCNTYQEMWENEVNKYCLSDWIFIDELFDLIIKGGGQ